MVAIIPLSKYLNGILLKKYLTNLFAKRNGPSGIQNSVSSNVHSDWKFPNPTENLNLRFSEYLRFSGYQDLLLHEILVKVFPHRRALSKILELV